VQRVGEYAMSLVGDGMLKGGSPLHRVTGAKQVRTRNGQQRILDGPFAEAKEVIAGYFVVEASSVEAATAIAARCPHPPDQPSLPATQKGGRPGAVGAGAATTRKRARSRPCRYSSCRR
jgi:hypothetical protein